ncbi:MAG: hypothetical protein HY841_04525 [Bacteroidetes bacterium]|nr:hypothetical protein [Bacteroidota bacterium]
MKTILISAMLLIAAQTFSQVYFIEQDKSPSVAATINTTSQERRVWIMGDKAKIMARSTKEGAMAGAEMSLSIAQQTTSAINPTFIAIAEADIKQGELELSNLKAIKNPTKEQKKSIDDLEAKLTSSKEKLKRMKSSPDGSPTDFDSEKQKTSIEQTDKESMSKDIQKLSGNADIIRMDKSVTWKINTAEMVYQEVKIESQMKGNPNTAMPAGLYSVSVQDIGDGGMIAGYKTKKYKITATMNAGGTATPYFSGEFWIAEELENAKQQINKFNNDYKLKTADEALPMLNLNAFIFDMVPEFNDKLNAIKGMILKKSYKGDGAMASMAYATEIAKVSVDPIDEKTFELPVEVKKQK